MADKLYPPIIGETLPAFYKIEKIEDGTTKEGISIVVPFSMNRSVSSDKVW